MVCGSLKKTKPLLSALWPSFKGPEKSTRKTRIEENPGDQVGANLSSIGNPEVTIQALSCLCRVALEGNIPATVTVIEDSKGTILQEGFVAHQIMYPFEDLR